MDRMGATSGPASVSMQRGVRPLDVRESDGALITDRTRDLRPVSRAFRVHLNPTSDLIYLFFYPK